MEAARLVDAIVPSNLHTMKYLVTLSICCSLWGATNALSSGLIPSLEDAGFAYEATEKCSNIVATFEATRKLRRSSRFRDGRRMFKNAVEQWGEDWACQTALQNLGSEIDFSDYASGRLVVQPPPSEIPPLPVRKSDLIADVAVQTEQ